MSLDVVDLRSFYASQMGNVARNMILRGIRKKWNNLNGMALLGLGYSIPYLDYLRDETERCLSFMPARQGVIAWPSEKPSSTSLIEPTDLPLRDSTIDRLLLIHALETSDDPPALMQEIWRILAPGGYVMIVVPNRSGPWARIDSTPFGHGQPFSKRQVTNLLRQALFTPTFWGEALFVPPINRKFFLSSAMTWEKIGSALSLPFAGVYTIEAVKQVYRPAMVGRSIRLRGFIEPILIPQGSGATAGRNEAE